MAAVVADTHAVIWYLLNQQTLSRDANAAIEQAVNAGDPIYLSTISLIHGRDQSHVRSDIARDSSGHAGPDHRGHGSPFRSAIDNKRSQNTSVASRKYLVEIGWVCLNHSSHLSSMKLNGGR
jgi:hypothetical protein